MKYILVIDHIATGGAERILIDYYHYLKQNGHVPYVFVLSGYSGQSKWTENVDVFYGSCNDENNLIKKTLQQFNLFFRLKKIVADIKPDVIFSFLEKSNLLTILVPTSAVKVVSVHNVLSLQYTKIKLGIVQKLTYCMIRWMYNKCNNVVAVSKQVKDDLIVSFGVRSENINVINNYVNSKDIKIKSQCGIDDFVFCPDKKYIMNKGVLQAHGEYLNFMNSGDEFYNNGVLQEVAPSLDSDIVVGKIVHGTEVWGFHKEDITLMDLIRGTVLHQASFFRKELFDENRYDESYKIVSDWKFYIQTLIFNNATFRNIRSIVCRFVPGGVSETDAGTRDMERKRVYKELFPDRMMKDYIRLEKVESPLLELIPELNKTAGLHQMAYKLVCALLWVHGKIKRVRVK